MSQQLTLPGFPDDEGPAPILAPTLFSVEDGLRICKMRGLGLVGVYIAECWHDYLGRYVVPIGCSGWDVRKRAWVQQGYRLRGLQLTRNEASALRLERAYHARYAADFIRGSKEKFDIHARLCQAAGGFPALPPDDDAVALFLMHLQQREAG